MYTMKFNHLYALFQVYHSVLLQNLNLYLKRSSDTNKICNKDICVWQQQMV